jgi:hypothetical protein
MRDIIITLPAKIKWEDYQQELNAVRDKSAVLNFRVPSLPKESGIGAKCYLVHRGQVVGFMLLSGLVEHQGFTCETSGKYWPAGKYLQRTGPFYKLATPRPKKGFQGWHYHT